MLVTTETPTRTLWRLPCGCVVGELVAGALIIAHPRTGRSWLLSRPLQVEVEATCKHGRRVVMTEDGARALEAA